MDELGRALSRREASDAVTGLGWRWVLGVLRANLRVGSLAEAADTAARIVAACGDDAGQRLAVDVRRDHVVLTVQQRAGGVPADGPQPQPARVDVGHGPRMARSRAAGRANIGRAQSSRSNGQPDTTARMGRPSTRVLNSMRSGLAGSSPMRKPPSGRRVRGARSPSG